MGTNDFSSRYLGEHGILNVLLEATQLDKEAHVYVRYGQEREAVKLWSTAVRIIRDVLAVGDDLDATTLTATESKDGVQNIDFASGEHACRNMMSMIRLQRGEVLYTSGKLSAALSDFYSVLGNADKPIMVTPTPTGTNNAAVAGAGAQLLVKCRALSCQTALFVLIGADERAEQSLAELEVALSLDGERINAERNAGVQGRASLASALAAKRPTAPLAVSAAEWHRARRMAIIHEHPEVRVLTLDRHSNEGLSLAAGIVAMSAGHFAVAWWLGAIASGTGGGLQGFVAMATVVVLFAASIGAFCAYGFQALIHELSHQLANKQINFVAMCMGSALCNFPWAM
jgi:hypothetical protein